MDIKRILASAPRTHDIGEPAPLTTVWGEALDPSSVRPEHPHPQFARDDFRMLNGWWQYAIVPTLDAGRSWRKVRPPARYDGRILVPFSPEAPLSGVGRTVRPDDLLWYRRAFATPELAEDDRCLLHFEAVDYACACYVNGELAGTHQGGYLPFCFDVTRLLHERPDHVAAHGLIEENELTLCVWDPSDQGTQLRGKQRLEHGGIWYTAQSGIWQPVWLEVVPACHVASLALRPDPAGEVLRLTVGVRGTGKLLYADVTSPEGVLVSRASVRVEDDGAPVEMAVDVPAPRLWCPDDPALYAVTLRYGHDVVHSYAAFRTVEVARDDAGVLRFKLNGQPLVLRGVLDQGYWPDGLMTAPADAALAFDIEAMRDAGFNLLRKHIKVEADRWYYHCDRLGMLVWQDMVSGGGPLDAWASSYKPTLLRWSWGRYADDTPRHQDKLSAGDEAYREEWRAACRDTVSYLGNHPSVVTWVLFNEGWGQFDAAEVAAEVRAQDPTRPVDAVSGWYDQHCGDFLSVHNYFRPLEVYPDDPSRLVGEAASRGGRAFAISEFGGLAHAVPDHVAYEGVYGYDAYDDAAAWARAVADQLAAADVLAPQGLSAWVYTQLSDVEEEVNGLLTYDRRVNKLERGVRAARDAQAARERARTEAPAEVPASATPVPAVATPGPADEVGDAPGPEAAAAPDAEQAGEATPPRPAATEAPRPAPPRATAGSRPARAAAAPCGRSAVFRMPAPTRTPWGRMLEAKRSQR
ncbi:MAG: glycoside hydrolase family 2 [Eggerthellaceae bacterium]|nr:glycoside hydrolase family 2 [Eggerthellaceae bacterium]